MRTYKTWKWEKIYVSSCKVCGQNFEHAKNNAMYCSEYCRGRSYYNYIKKPIQISKCKYCKKDSRHKKNNAMYCSPRCRSSYVWYNRNEVVI